MERLELAAIIGEKLREEREKPPKINQSEAALIAGVNARTWQDYENGRTLAPLDAVFKFAKARLIDPSVLIPLDRALPLLLGSFPVRMVPVLNRIPAGPLGLSLMDEHPSEFVATESDDPEAFALHASGDSMAPRIESGDLIVLSPREEFLNEKIYAIVTVDSEHSLKLVRRNRDEFWCVPLNPAYRPIVLHESQVLRLIRVIQITKRA